MADIIVTLPEDEELWATASGFQSSLLRNSFCLRGSFTIFRISVDPINLRQL